ncbi:MAG TPA: bifunctional phosphopantothenoylcysteine decarboxylase/phosphopantothenate--cysteine ligase CoaBC [Acidimicrobiales bacterium]|nr:bifunctional phosphopantothenoylcysteine decarboxylase/phosphopantothenate--cysteine ligase CoaBC [Acidimicrobiales bacterium]
MTWTPSPMPSATPKPSTPRIVLGVAGGIAAYKSVELLRLLRDKGYHVAPILTPDATRFVGTATFSALASEPARTSLYGDLTTPIPHTYLGSNATLVVVAPATAHLIARYAMGLADDLLTATLLATRAPVLLCPAMHTEMWEQPSVQENLATLRRRGVLVLEPESGHLAGGDEGTGRLADPATIAELVEKIVTGYRGALSGVHVLISAGGTRESIDPVRVLSNRSSGRQGYALAEVATRMGARVTLVSTVNLALSLDTVKAIEVVSVESAAQMHDAMTERSEENDVVIMAAAVADFTVSPASEKLKKREGLPELHFEPAADILADLLLKRRPEQVFVGFAAETTNVLENATAKLKEKGVDLLVVNDVSAPGAGFEHSTNEVVLLGANDEPTHVSLRSKEAISWEILARVAALLPRGAQ